MNSLPPISAKELYKKCVLENEGYTFQVEHYDEIIKLDIVRYCDITQIYDVLKDIGILTDNDITDIQEFRVESHKYTRVSKLFDFAKSSNNRFLLGGICVAMLIKSEDYILVKTLDHWGLIDIFKSLT